MKEIEKIEASIYLYDCLKEVLPEYAVKFMKELKNKFPETQILDFNEDEIREIYSDSNVAPGIYLKFNEIKIEELCFVKLEDMKNISKDFYDNLTKLETNLGQNDVESRNGKKAVDMSLENTNFRKVSIDNKFLMNLLEDDTREKEVERVHEEIEVILKKAGLK